MVNGCIKRLLILFFQQVKLQQLESSCEDQEKELGKVRAGLQSSFQEGETKHTHTYTQQPSVSLKRLMIHQLQDSGPEWV